jgi:ferric-dicitrate binding protein FerR (iron transport regulator)
MAQTYPNFDISNLIARYLDGTLTAEEWEKLNVWIEENDEHKRIWKALTDPKHLEANLSRWRAENLDESWNKLQSMISDNQSAVKRVRRLQFFKYAAAIIGVIVSGLAVTYLLTSKQFSAAEPTSQTQVAEILPQGKVAKLVLGNGTVVSLNGSKNSPIVEEDGTKVFNDQNGVHYSSDNRIDNKELYNTLIVPRSGEYRVVLSDGTKVWLNAASSLKYPTKFSTNQRKVILSGEAYFEVTKDVKRPFIVKTDNTQVEVLGTKFNVSAYTEDSKNKVSLAEGKVVVEQLKQGKKERVVLMPGYGAVVEKHKKGIQTTHVNLEADLAWKDAMFVFEDEALGSIMKKLSRWYDVNIEFEKGVDTLFHFTGHIEKYENLAKTLHLLELTRKVSFDISDHNVTVERYREKSTVQLH